MVDLIIKSKLIRIQIISKYNNNESFNILIINFICIAHFTIKTHTILYIQLAVKEDEYVNDEC